jgi:hypothetical protein
MNDELYDRQRRLPGIGDAGQAAIERSRARLPSGPSAGVALSYLVRAGVGSVAIVHDSEQLSGRTPATSSEQSPSFPHLHSFRFSAPLEFARGAHLALSHLIYSVRTQ